MKFLLPEPILDFPATGRVKNRPITTEIKILSELRYLLRKRQGRERGRGEGMREERGRKGKIRMLGKVKMQRNLESYVPNSPFPTPNTKQKAYLILSQRRPDGLVPG